MEQISNEEVARRFATAILLQAVVDKIDLKKRGFVLDDTGQIDKTASDEELQEFFASEWCADLCDMAGISHQNVRKKFLNKRHV